MTPYGRRVASFVAACVAIDLYGYAIYHAWRTHLIGPGVTLLLLSIVSTLGLIGLALAPRWIRTAQGEMPQPQPVARAPMRRWLIVVLALVSIAAGVGLAFGDRFLLGGPAHPVAAQWLAPVAFNTACVGLLIFTFIRLRRPSRFGIVFAVILTIDMALQLTPGTSLTRLVSLRFVFALIQMGAFSVPLALWAGHLWERVMTAIFTPPRR